MIKKYPIQLTVNGEVYDLMVDPGKSLLKLLREDLDLTGTKEGCGEGDCGACSVILDGKVVNSCLVLAVETHQCEVMTIEGVQAGEDLHPIQEAFVNNGAVQCGFCSPGMIMATKAMLDEIPDPSEEEIKHYLEGNLCRCTGYKKILDAVNQVKGHSE
jgi:aerobic carbon-monoxide dehydrogenase small subunit